MKHESNVNRVEHLLYKETGYVTNHLGEMDLWSKVSFSYLEVLSACRLMISFKVGEAPLRCNTGRYNGEVRHLRVCILCDSGNIENSEHFLFECAPLHNARTVFFESLCRLTDDGVDIIQRRAVDDVINPKLDRPDYKALSIVAWSVYSMYDLRGQFLEQFEQNDNNDTILI